jgi:hypothetical protein
MNLLICIMNYSAYLWIKKKTAELINSLFPKFPHILCFPEHHLKQIELEQINLELHAAYRRKSLLKGGVCIFVHLYI